MSNTTYKHFLFVVLLLLPVISRAEITYPYVVDEKSQVLFGDSGLLVDDKLGLEAYTQDYVNGYLHITFTYTHHVGNFASYSPNLYVTTIDPRTTPSSAVRSLTAPYPVGTFEPTDWYKYDIQFDSGGYQVVVKRASTTTEIVNRHEDISGLTDTDWVSLANLYPMGATPSENPYSMSFTPVPLTGSAKPPTPTRNPVIIIPGIMGSYLTKEDGTEVWMNVLKMAQPGDDSYLDDLLLSSSGQPLNNLNAAELILSAGMQDYFDGLIETLENNGYVENVDLFVFPYDWRLNIDEVVEKFGEKIQAILLESETGSKVDIIAHSMGGLLTKSYLKSGGTSIDRFIDLGTPHNGAPKSFKVLYYGDDLNANFLFGLIGLNSNRIKIISQNMPSIHQLLPSEEYVNSYGSYVYDLDDMDSNGVRGSLNYDETKEFMKNSGRNSLLIDSADSFHSNLDGLDPRDYGVETYNIVSCGVPTLGKIFVLNKELSGGAEYNIAYTNGDGTVPLKSAEAMSADTTYYVENAVHATMPSTSGVKELVAAILSSDTEFDLSDHPNLRTSSAGCNIPNGRIVSFHSPVDLHIYDEEGNHVGPNSSGDIEYDIPGVTYDVIDGNKFAFLPDGEVYTVEGSATAAGTFNTRIETIVDEEVVGTTYYHQVPLTSTTQVVVNESSLSLDQESDGIFEQVVQPSAVLNEIESGDVVKPVSTANVSVKARKDGAVMDSKPVDVTLSAMDDNSGVLSTEYSLNNGVWTKYVGMFTVGTKGQNTLLYRSTDKAGNVEGVKSLAITIAYPGNSGIKR